MDLSRGAPLLDLKSLILVSQDRPKRLAAMEGLSQHLTAKGYTLFRLPELKTDAKYLKQAAKLFPLVSPLKIPKSKMSLAAIDDVQLDWIDHKKKSAILIPELHQLRAENAGYFTKLVSTYLTRSVQLWEVGAKKAFRFVFSVDEVPSNIIDTLEIYYGAKDRRPAKEIAADHIALYPIR